MAEPTPKRVLGTLNIDINLDGPIAALQGVLREGVARAAFGLRSAADYKGSSVELPNVFPQINMGRTVAVAEARLIYGPWLLGSILRDCFDGLDPLLWDVWRLARVANLPTEDGLLRASDYNAFVEEQERFLARKTLGNKLAAIREQFPGVIPARWEKPLGGLIKLRNCLTHARGVVRQQDLTTPKRLTVTYPVLRPVVVDQQGNARRLKPGHVGAEGEWLAMQQRWQRRILAPGARVSFSPQQFAELLLSLLAFALDLRSSLVEVILKPRGIVAPDLDLRPRLSFQVVRLDQVGEAIKTWAATRQLPPRVEFHFASRDLPAAAAGKLILRLRHAEDADAADLVAWRSELSELLGADVTFAEFDASQSGPRIYPR